MAKALAEFQVESLSEREPTDTNKSVWMLNKTTSKNTKSFYMYFQPIDMYCVLNVLHYFQDTMCIIPNKVFPNSNY